LQIDGSLKSMKWRK